MAEKRKRSQNFTDDEKQKLIKLLMEHKDTILSKKTDGSTNEAKLSAWIQITASFNATGSVCRSKKSLLKMWEKLKSASKIYYSSTRKSIEQTGGDTCTVKRDPLLAQVCSIMGHNCTEVEEDNDSNAVEAIICECDSESLSKVICSEDGLETDGEVPFVSDDPLKETIPGPWPRSRRRKDSSSNERSESIITEDSGFKDKKKKDADEIKIMMLEEELNTKRQLNELQIQAASKELVIKDLEIKIRKAVLKSVRGGNLPWPCVFGGHLRKIN